MKNPNDPIQNQTKDLTGCSGYHNSTKQQKIRAYDITTGLNQSHNMSVCAGRGNSKSWSLQTNFWSPSTSN